MAPNEDKDAVFEVVADRKRDYPRDGTVQLKVV
jgi:hypothetical protein